MDERLECLLAALNLLEPQTQPTPSIPMIPTPAPPRQESIELDFDLDGINEPVNNTEVAEQTEQTEPIKAVEQIEENDSDFIPKGVMFNVELDEDFKDEPQLESTLEETPPVVDESEPLNSSNIVEETTEGFSQPTETINESLPPLLSEDEAFTPLPETDSEIMEQAQEAASNLISKALSELESYHEHQESKSVSKDIDEDFIGQRNYLENEILKNEISIGSKSVSKKTPFDFNYDFEKQISIEVEDDWFEEDEELMLSKAAEAIENKKIKKFKLFK